MFQTMNSVRSNNVSLKYQRPTPSGCKDIGIIKFEFVAKTQFLYLNSKSLCYIDGNYTSHIFSQLYM